MAIQLLNREITNFNYRIRNYTIQLRNYPIPQLLNVCEHDVARNFSPVHVRMF